MLILTLTGCRVAQHGAGCICRRWADVAEEAVVLRGRQVSDVSNQDETHGSTPSMYSRFCTGTLDE